MTFSRPATATAVTRPTTGKYVAESQLEEVNETPDICIEDIDNDSSILGDEVTTEVQIPETKGSVKSSPSGQKLKRLKLYRAMSFEPKMIPQVLSETYETVKSNLDIDSPDITPASKRKVAVRHFNKMFEPLRKIK